MYTLQPEINDLKQLVANTPEGNLVPVYIEISADLITPTAAYLKLSANSDYSFLFESVSGNEKIGRYSFLGSNPYHIITSGEGRDIQGDPLIAVENYLKQYKFINVASLPSFTGGAIGYVSFDCIKYFEPRTDKPVQDNLKLPESLHMFCDNLVIFDHLYQIIKIVTHIRGDLKDASYLEDQYKLTKSKLEGIADILVNAPTVLPAQKPIKLDNEYSENVDQKRYEHFVNKLKEHIVQGDIIQAVPSRRLARPTDLHPFNVYRHLRQVNPAPYLFFLDCKDFQVVGASPEMLVKVDADRKVYTHPIAGTRKRGKTEEEDKALEKDLLTDRKEIAEHTMLVDLGRNDVNRICQPTTTKVDSLMHIEKYSHVMHIVSNVSGILREDQTPFDAFRSIFPAGTVSGAPKVKAIELIRELEGETRGVYAGSVGHFDYSGTIDTCIAIRTMLFKDGVAYLQAGGGIVYHSDPVDEYIETVNKLNSNVATIAKAEKFYASQQ